MFSNHVSSLSSNEDTLELKPFINYLVVLIPVLMFSAELSPISFHSANLSERGLNFSSTQVQANSINELTIILGTSLITYSKDNAIIKSISYNNTHFPSKEIEADIKFILKGNLHYTNCNISTDSSVKYDYLIQCMDIVKKAGISNISIGRSKI